MSGRIGVGTLFFFGCLMFIFFDLGKTLSDPNRGKMYCEGIIYPDGLFGRQEQFSGWYTKEEVDNRDESIMVSYSCGTKP